MFYSDSQMLLNAFLENITVRLILKEKVKLE